MSIPIVLEKVSAIVKVGSTEFVTPGRGRSENYILSFNISSSIQQPHSTCRCQLSAKDSLNLDSGETLIEVWGGVNSAPVKLFSGFVTHMSQDPHWNDASRTILNISGESPLAKLRGQKVTSRFKMRDSAYAVITGGVQRPTNPTINILQSQKLETGETKPWADPTENSPVVRNSRAAGSYNTADTPRGAAVERLYSEDLPSDLIFKPNYVYASAGDQIVAQIVQKSNSMLVDVKYLCETVSNKGFLTCTPCLDDPTKTNCAITLGKTDSYPVSVKLGSPDDPSFSGFTITVTSDYPAIITFVHPLNAHTARFTIMPVPIHDHRTMGRGGPAVGSYDVFQV